LTAFFGFEITVFTDRSPNRKAVHQNPFELNDETMKTFRHAFMLLGLCLVIMSAGCGKDAKLPSLWPETAPLGEGPAFSLKSLEFKAPTFGKKDGPTFWERFVDPKSKAINESLSKLGPSWGTAGN